MLTFDSSWTRHRVDNLNKRFFKTLPFLKMLPSRKPSQKISPKVFESPHSQPILEIEDGTETKSTQHICIRISREPAIFNLFTKIYKWQRESIKTTFFLQTFTRRGGVDPIPQMSANKLCFLLKPSCRFV